VCVSSVQLLRRERDAAMTSIVDHTEIQKKLKQGEAQLLKGETAGEKASRPLQENTGLSQLGKSASRSQV
jgi:hypothetical protein